MAFNKVGSWSECPPQTSLSDDNVEQYCLADNLDGARLIAPIRSGKWVVDEGATDAAHDILHIDEVAEAVNQVRATAWTPLAEAMYNAIGYYTQDNTTTIKSWRFSD